MKQEFINVVFFEMKTQLPVKEKVLLFCPLKSQSLIDKVATFVPSRPN